MSVHFLPSALDTVAALPLHTDLSRRMDQGEAIALDGSAVVRTGLACLQVLAAARVTAIAQGSGFTLIAPSANFSEMATLAHLDIIFDRVC